MTSRRFVLTLSCPDRPGIVAAVSALLFEAGCNIVEAQQFDDTETIRFFMRVVFGHVDETFDPNPIRGRLSDLANRFAMSWKLRDRSERHKVVILVSNVDHCLVDLLYRWRIGELVMKPEAIISNHGRDHFSDCDFGSIPFFHLPVTPATKPAQEREILRVISGVRADLVVLARYMQILSEGTTAQLYGRCINIHHSFLPGFKGARPYQQAFERGVKLIGATAHFVSNELDEGPIIEQDIERINHTHDIADLVRIGRDIERRVLARAVRYYLDDRVLLNGSKTVVFD